MSLRQRLAAALDRALDQEQVQDVFLYRNRPMPDGPFTPAAVLMAISAATESEQWLPAIFRFGIVPLFLFSGTFFPVEQLPDWIEPLAWATPLWHGVELTRDLATGEIEAASAAVHVGYLVALTVLGTAIAARACGRKLLR